MEGSGKIVKEKDPGAHNLWILRIRTTDKNVRTYCTPIRDLLLAKKTFSKGAICNYQKYLKLIWMKNGPKAKMKHFAYCKKTI